MWTTDHGQAASAFFLGEAIILFIFAIAAGTLSFASPKQGGILMVLALVGATLVNLLVTRGSGQGFSPGVAIIVTGVCGFIPVPLYLLLLIIALVKNAISESSDIQKR